MDKKNKILIIYIGTIVLLCLIFLIFVNKKANKNENIETNSNTNTVINNNGNEQNNNDDNDNEEKVAVKLSPKIKEHRPGSSKTVKDLSSIINNSTFIASNLVDNETEYEMSAKVSGKNIIIDGTDKIYTLENISGVKAIKLSIQSAADLYPIQLYVLTKDSFYNILIYEDNSSVINKYNISNIESFVMNPKRLDSTEVWRNFVIIKTKDNKYYTDYHFKSKTYKSDDVVDLLEIK